MNIPKAIRSLISNGFLSISTTPILCKIKWRSSHPVTRLSLTAILPQFSPSYNSYNRHIPFLFLPLNISVSFPLFKAYTWYYLSRKWDTKRLNPHYKPIPSIQKSCSRLRWMHLKGQWKDKVKEGLTQFNVFSPFSVQSLFFILWVANRWQSHHFQPLKVLKMLILCGLKGKLFQRAMSVQ